MEFDPPTYPDLKERRGGTRMKKEKAKENSKLTESWVSNAARSTSKHRHFHLFFTIAA
jgi:hypothetical protein